MSVEGEAANIGDVVLQTSMGEIRIELVCVCVCVLVACCCLLWVCCCFCWFVVVDSLDSRFVSLDARPVRERSTGNMRRELVAIFSSLPNAVRVCASFACVRSVTVLFLCVFSFFFSSTAPTSHRACFREQDTMTACYFTEL